jgi:hypothetical protein
MDAIHIDELVAIAKGKDERSTKENVTVVRFIKEQAIEAGENRVPTYVVYYTYKKLGYTKVGKTEFFRTFNKYFKQVRTSKQRYYLLNDAICLESEYVTKARFNDQKTQTVGGNRVTKR